MRIAVLGAGAWGTALAVHYAAQHAVILWGRSAAHCEALTREGENRRYLPGISLPRSLAVSSDLAAVLAAAELLIIATPLAGLRSALESVKSSRSRVPVLWACKGLEPETGLFPHQIVEAVFGNEIASGALSGPSFAQEVAKQLPTAITLAMQDAPLARHLIAQLNTPRLRLYANDDVIGVEVAGAVKNVLAIGAGISDGMGFGLNARAALITRGLAEISRLGTALGGRSQTFMGLAGLGDLILTCTGDLSRNRRVGLRLAEGQSLSQVLAELGHTAEGVHTAQAVAQRAAALGVDMPITSAVESVLFRGTPPKTAVEQLLSRHPKAE